MSWQRIALVTDIPDDAPLETGTGGEPLALYRVNGEVYCTANLCTHAEAFLSDGYLEGFEIECPLHGARFDIRNGRVLCQPASKDIVSYAVKVEEGVVFVDV
ncbi:MAG: non-heme iron oxygenase ferredoxin subunit [Casimicrobiaceae bacterium]